MRRDALYELPIFDGISGSELNWLLANSAQVRLDKAEYFTREHDPYVRFYVVLDGELQVSRTLNGTQTVLGTTPRGIIGGELSILNNTPSEVTVQAIMPSTLMVLEPDVFRALFSACPIVGTRILRTAAERMSGLAVRVTQQEKMAALGRLSAGLAHELNNPAAAARRSAQSLRESLAALQIHTLRLHACALTQPQLELLLSLQSYVWSSAGNPPALDPIERSDRESSLGVWLAELGIA